MNNFTFLPSYFAAVQDLPEEQKNKLIAAICEYGVTGKEPVLEGLERSVFTLVKPIIDNDVNFRKSCSEAGKSGGRGNKKGNEKVEKGRKMVGKGMGKGREKVKKHENENDNENELNTAKPLRGIAKSLFDDLPAKKIEQIAQEKRVSVKTIEQLKENYVNWVKEKTVDKNRQNRSMSATIQNWLNRGLAEGKIKRLELFDSLPLEGVELKSMTQAELDAARSKMPDFIRRKSTQVAPESPTRQKGNYDT